MKATRFDIWAAILNERNYQDEKWGHPDHHPHSIFEWIGIMEREIAEVKEAFFQRSADEEMLGEILQVVAVGVACMEQHGIVERSLLTDEALANGGSGK